MTYLSGNLEYNNLTCCWRDKGVMEMYAFSSLLEAVASTTRTKLKKTTFVIITTTNRSLRFAASLFSDLKLFRFFNKITIQFTDLYRRQDV